MASMVLLLRFAHVAKENPINTMQCIAMVAHQLSLIWAIPESNNFSWGVFP